MLIKGLPPNIREIQKHFPVTKDTVYAYGDDIYALEEVPPDIEYHERVHLEQQKKWTSPDIWWQKYLLDAEFRLEQEVEAFAAQVKWVREHTNSAIGKGSLEVCSEVLASEMYKLGITKSRAESLIRHRIK